MPQISSPALEMKWVVCCRSSLVPQSFPASVAPSGHSCLLRSWWRGQSCRTCSGVWGPVSHGQFGVCDSPSRHRCERRRQCPVRSRKITTCWWRWRWWIASLGLWSLSSLEQHLTSRLMSVLASLLGDFVVLLLERAAVLCQSVCLLVSI